MHAANTFFNHLIPTDNPLNSYYSMVANQINSCEAFFNYLFSISVVFVFLKKMKSIDRALICHSFYFQIFG